MVYVDSTRHEFGRMIMCHMLADTEEELHAMAEKIGLKRSWFQAESTPHYDVSLAKRKLAIQNGAIVIGRKETVEIIRANRRLQ